MSKSPSRRSTAATVVVLFLFITTGYAIPTFTETIFPFLQANLNASAAWLGGVSAPSPALEASVTTDKPDYRPGQIVHITGGGFGPGEEVRLEVDYVPTGLKAERPDFSGVPSGHDPWYVTADGGGNFISDWLVEEDSLNQTLRLTADGQSSGLHAETTFTDAAIGTYDQCSNDEGDGYPGPADVGCHWINGNLNANNSTYHEGDSTVQRLWIDDVTPGSTHTITFQYGTTKGGKHAYDYITTWDQSENWITIADRCQDIPGCTTTTEHVSPQIPNDPNVTDTIEPNGAGSRLFTVRGATITAVSTPTVVSGSYAADSETEITISVTMDGSGPMCDTGGCGIAVWFGAHIARTDLWQPFNGTTGATTIPGSPYHVALAKLDGGSIGNRDNQMQANAIVPPTGVLTITKTTLGGFGTFGYTVSPTPSPLPSTGAFNLTTSAPVNPASTSFAAVPAGSYTVTEDVPPPGWVLFSLTCSGDLDGGNVITLGSRRVVIDLDNTEGQNCTFVNIKPDARIVLSPVTANNEINSPHTIVATVTQNDQLDAGAPGDGTTGLGPVPDGTLVTFSLLNNTANASFVAGNTCLTSGGTGTCSVQINSSNVGGVDVRATTTFGVLGVNLTRTTNDGISGDGVDSHKNYVSGTIAITPSAVNEVNHQHTFTVVVTQAPGAAAPATSANITITPSPVPGTVTNNCVNPVAFSGNTATCTYIINNASAGLFTVNASAVFTIGGVTITRSTNGSGGNSGPATKRFVDAQIDLTPLTATNPVNQAHTVTATVQQDDGLASGAPGDGATGFGPAPNGVTVTFSLLNNTAGATFVAGNTCVTAGGTGVCTIQINSTTPGGVDIHATTTFPVGGVSLTRATGTGGLNSADAHKDYVAGSITIVKDAVPNSALDFNFSTTGTGLSNFALDDDADPTLLNTRTFNNLAPGPYTVTEAGLPIAGWDLTNLVCIGGGANTSTTLATGLSTIGLDAGENVTCTYTNTRRGHIIVVKDAVPNDEQDFTFTNNFGNGNPAMFPLDDDADPTLSNSRDSEVLPGTFAVSEGAVSGWDATSATCSDGSPVGAIVVSPGETVTCTFVNTKRGHIIVVKDAVPNDAQDFIFTNNFGSGNPAMFPLDDDADPTLSNSRDSAVLPGTFAVSEGAVSGWDPTSATCSDGSPVGAIVVSPGETVTCTFVNTKRGHIIVVKDAVPNDAQDFTFTNNFGSGNPAMFPLDDDADPTLSNSRDSEVLPGTFAVSEGAVSGWDATSATCSDGSPVGAIVVSPGETVTCTFVNTKRAHVIIVKDAVPNDAQDFTFTNNFGNGNPAMFPLDDDADPTLSNSRDSEVLPGTFAVSEGAVSGWDPTSATCSDGSPVGAIVVSAGETVTCTFVNTKRGHIIVVKDAVPNDAQDFIFTNNFGSGNPAMFPLDDDADPTLSNSRDSAVLPGTFAVSEGAVIGWDPTSATCSDGSPVNAIVVSAGETVTCTFVNTKRGAIKIVKNTVGGNGAFTFNPTGFNANAPFDLTTVAGMAMTTFVNIAPGTGFSVSESVPAGWDLTSFVCDNGTPAGFAVLPGATTTCTATNKKLPTLILRKVIQGQSQLFSFVVSGSPVNPPNTNIDLTPPANSEASSSSQVIQPGNYSVTETPIPVGWLLTDASCVSDQGGFNTDNSGLPIVTFTAGYGDDVVCSYFDMQQGGATRTQGFWSTHTVLTNAIWNGTALPPGTGTITPVPVIGSADAYLCKPPTIIPPFAGVEITAIPAVGQNQVLGGFWAGIAKSTVGRRNDLDQARMQFLQQYLAAVLNVHAFGTSIGTTTLANARAAYCGSDPGPIGAQKSLLAAYNESGDNVEFTPGVSATAKLSRTQANIVFWDITFR